LTFLQLLLPLLTEFAMHLFARRLLRLTTSAGAALAGLSIACTASAAPTIVTVAGMPPVVNANNLYSEAGAGHLSPAVAGALPRIYVPNLRSNDVYVIDPATFTVVDRVHVGIARNMSSLHGT
jgi:YVTN family beta-propeller protein